MEETPLANSTLFRRFKALESFSQEDRATVINVIDAIITKRQVESAIKPLWSLFGERYVLHPR